MLCPQCGGNLNPNANFCKYCGSKINQESSEVPEETNHEDHQPKYEKEESLFDQAIMSDETHLAETDSSNEVVDPFLQEDKFDPITDDVIDILYSRERDVDIKTELKEILDEVNKIEQRLEIGLVAQTEATELIKEKQELISALRSERKSLKDGKLPVETLSAEIKEAKDKLDKLQLMHSQGKIQSEKVYEKLKNEYSEAYNTKVNQFEQEQNNLKHWLQVLEFDVYKMKEDIEILKAKAGVGEISEQEAETKQTMLEIDIYRKELAYHALKAIETNL